MDNIVLNFSLIDQNPLFSPNITQINNKYFIDFPCPSSDNCTGYEVILPKGRYSIELYGASGSSTNGVSSYRYSDNTFIDSNTVEYYHGNAQPCKLNSCAGAGGYTSGFITLPKETKIFIQLGGKGGIGTNPSCTDNISCEDDIYRPPPGYNGGGRGLSYTSEFFSGGGASDIRAEKNDLFHRILVAGGGGGPDNARGNETGGDDDGSGGAGGGLVAQGFFIAGVLVETNIATKLTGFSFGQGEAALYGESRHPNGSKRNYGHSDRAGAGGGWFGGFSSQHGNGGGGGGSSFALTMDAVFPTEKIKLHNDHYDVINEGEYYAFQNHEYVIDHPVFERGIWDGNGRAVITCFGNLIKTYPTKYDHIKTIKNAIFIVLISNKINK